MSQLEPPYGAIWKLLKKGQVIPFLGAGASLGIHPEPWNEKKSYLPKGSELANYLAELASFPRDEPRDDLPKVAQYYRVVIGRLDLRQELHAIFGREYPCCSIHEFLADVDTPLLIVTTNYDDLIERAFKARGRPFDLVIHPTNNREWAAAVIHWQHEADKPDFVHPNDLSIPLNKRTVIYKMHGAVDRQDPSRDSYIITEDDYVDFLTRMASQTAIPFIFAEHFRARHFLFLGYSLRDWNLRVVLSKIERDWPRWEEGISSWAIQYKPSALERELWSRRGVMIFDMTIEDFVTRLPQERARQEEHDGER